MYHLFNPMKKFSLLFCTVVLYAQCFAQATTKIIKDSLPYREKYSVLKSNPQVKQGDYQLILAASTKILTTGAYKNNKKDGLWHDYDFNDHVASEGRYQDGQKVGEWKYYGDLWKLTNKYNFTTNQLAYHDPTKMDSINIYKVVRGPGDTIKTKLEYGPIYLSGDYVMYRPLLYNVIAPPDAVKNHVADRVFVSFTIDENGHARDYHVDNHVGHGCDEEAVRLVKQIPDDWVPGRLNGKNVAVVLRLPVGFNFRK
jgi:protein TonB